MKQKKYILIVITSILASVLLAAVVVSASTTVGNDVSVGGDLTVTGTSTLNGNVILGDAASDTITITGTPTFSATGTTFNATTTFNGNFVISGQIISNLAAGNSPFQISSNTLVDNLNADILDSQHGSYYASKPELYLSNDLVKDNNNPVLTLGDSGAWDDSRVLDPCVIKESDGTYKMWYLGIGSDSSHAIGYATSSDGITWTKDSNNPVLQGDSGEWDDSSIIPAVILVDDEFVMFYSNNSAISGAPAEIGIGIATSHDGSTWTKYQNNPILNNLKGSSGEWDSFRAGLLAVIKDSDTTPYFLVYYRGSASGNNWRIGLIRINSASINNNFLVRGTGSFIDNSSSSALTVNQSGSGCGAVITGGNVGIGTTTPSSLFHVSQSSATSTVTVGNSSANSLACLKLRDSDDGGWSYCTILDGTINCTTTSCE